MRIVTLPQWISRPGDVYRHAIEELSRGSVYTEIEVAEKVLQKSHAAGNTDPNDPTYDPGYFLLWKGRPEFEKQLAFHVPLRTRFDRAVARTGICGYLVTIATVSGSILALFLIGISIAGVTGSALFFLALLALIPVSGVGVALVNHWITNRFGPKALPV
jgi:cyclic beta-1,2-glucan synthetase